MSSTCCIGPSAGVGAAVRGQAGALALSVSVSVRV